MEPIKPYTIVYRVHGLPEVERSFMREIEMENYATIWLDDDIDYVNYFYYDVEYTPEWAK